MGNRRSEGGKREIVTFKKQKERGNGESGERCNGEWDSKDAHQIRLCLIKHSKGRTKHREQAVKGRLLD